MVKLRTGLLMALGKIASRHPGRHALNHIQARGETLTVTDGTVLAQARFPGEDMPHCLMRVPVRLPRPQADVRLALKCRKDRPKAPRRPVLRWPAQGGPSDLGKATLALPESLPGDATFPAWEEIVDGAKQPTTTICLGVEKLTRALAVIREANRSGLGDDGCVEIGLRGKRDVVLLTPYPSSSNATPDVLVVLSPVIAEDEGDD